MWQIRIKARSPAIGWEGQWWIRGGPPLGTVWFQLAITVPAILGFDLEVARKSRGVVESSPCSSA